MTMLLDGRLRDLATQTHLLETKVSSLGWMAGAGAQTLKSMSGIGREFDDHANCLACFGVNVGGELGDDRDKAKAGWIGYVRDQRRQAMLGELADVLQTVGNLIAAFGITDEEVAQAMDDCLERNRERGRL